MSENADTPSGKKREKLPWTVLVYMVADDPSATVLLDDKANRELDELIFATLARRRQKQSFHVATQVDFRTHHGVVRRVVGGGTWQKAESNAADPDTLYGFFDWAKNECPAERYMLIFWGHSQGPFGLFADKDPWVWAAQTLTLTELSAALKAARFSLQSPIDIVLFKDCFMSNVEAAYELRAYAKYLIASQGLVPTDIWPYEKILECLTGGVHSGEAARRIAKVMGDVYRNDEGVPFSILDTSMANGVFQALKDVVTALRQPNPRRGRLEAEMKRALRRAVVDRGDTALIDVREFCKELGHTGVPQELQDTLGALDSAAEDLVIAFHSKLKRSKRRGAKAVFSGVSLFCHPLRLTDRKQPRILGRASRDAYLSLGLTGTGWPAIALATMPQPINGVRYEPFLAALPGFARMLLPLAVVEQLQQAGYLEALRRQATSMAQQTMADLLTAQMFGPPPKGDPILAGPPKGDPILAGPPKGDPILAGPPKGDPILAGPRLGETG